MDRFGPTLVVAAITLLVLVGMWWGWRRRTRRDARLTAGHTAPQDLGDERVSFDAFYVATTAHDRPLERLAVAGLGFRARARVCVHDAGVTLSIPGERPVFIAARAIDAANRATVTIDRVVEPGGLVRLAWRIPVVASASTPTRVPSTPSSAPAAPANNAPQAADPRGTENEGTLVDSYLRPIAPEAATAFLDTVAAIAPDAAVSTQTPRKRGAA